jgi:hypothetical protein
MHLMSQLVGIIAHPRQFMQLRRFDIGAWPALIIVTIALIALRLEMVPELRKEYSTSDFKKWYIEQQHVNEEKADQDIAKMSQIAPVMSLLEAPVMVVAGAAGIAVFLFLVGRVSYKQKIGFVDIFNMVSWASVIAVVPLLIQVGFKIGGVEMNLPTNVAWFLPKSLEGSYFYNVLQAVDLFLIWQVWLLALGIVALFQVTLQRALTSVGTLFVTLAVLNAIATTMSGK